MPSLAAGPKREFALRVLERIRAAGFEAYWAGGCVRDQLLGAEPKDYDVATSAVPDEVRTIFGKHATVGVGESFGVIMVLGPPDAGQVEVATFRHDGRYSDGRRPDAVTFGTAEEDVQRRDFTINGMLYDPIEGRVLDFVGGQRDLQAGVVRAIGDPRQRFSEDKLRLLRAVRFAARFDFRLEEHTRAAVAEMASQITVVAAERIAQEMRAMLAHVNRHKAMRLAMETGLLPVILPEIATLKIEAWQQTLRVLENLATTRFTLAMAALLHAAGGEERQIERRGESGARRHVAETCAACRRWRLSNDEMERITWLVEHQGDLRGAPERQWSAIQPLLMHGGAEELIELHEALAQVHADSLADLEFCRRKRQLPLDVLDPPPLLTGDDLIAQDLPRGRIYQVILNRVRDAQLDGEVSSRAEALQLAMQIISG